MAIVAILVGLRRRELRPILVSFVLAPVIVGVLTSYMFRAIWIDRTLLFTTPFLAIAFANVFLIAVGPAWGTSRVVAGASLTAIFCMVLAALGLWQVRAIPKPTDFERGAAVIRSQLQPDDLVYVPDNFYYWGLAWYAIGPDWGSPLSVQGNSPLDCNDRWCVILERLGPVWRKRLHLEPTTRVVWRNNIPFFVGRMVPNEVHQASRVWLVDVPGEDYPDPAKIKSKVVQDWTDHRGLRIRLLSD
jgi:hypothetical protein